MSCDKCQSTRQVWWYSEWARWLCGNCLEGQRFGLTCWVEPLGGGVNTCVWVAEEAG